MSRARLRDAIASFEIITIEGGEELRPGAWADHYRDCLKWCELNGWDEIDPDTVRAWCPR